jgi:hypothetical protein
MRHLMVRVDRARSPDVTGGLRDRAFSLAANTALAFCLACIAIGVVTLYLYGPF